MSLPYKIMSSGRLFQSVVNFGLSRSVRSAVRSSYQWMNHNEKHLCSLSSCRRCWKCSFDMASNNDFFCPSCNVIQPLAKDATYFEIMNSPQSFNIEPLELANQFRELQWKLHPDKFSALSKDEKTLSDEQSSAVNKAYSTLLKPLSRGLYLLKLHGMSLAEGETTSADNEFLMEIMEINEELANASSEKVQRISQMNKEKLDECIQNVSAAFEKGDLEAARDGLMKMKYYSNIDDQIRESESWN